tara:strand:- start:210 stop:353 length:144 start_codon:yes stop_codon:yes gene_type:complete
MYINPNYYLEKKIYELQDKVLLLTDQLADTKYQLKKLQQKESLKCQK